MNTPIVSTLALLCAVTLGACDSKNQTPAPATHNHVDTQVARPHVPEPQLPPEYEEPPEEEVEELNEDAQDEGNFRAAPQHPVRVDPQNQWDDDVDEDEPIEEDEPLPDEPE